jgi:hypothetical protein
MVGGQRGRRLQGVTQRVVVENGAVAADGSAVGAAIEFSGFIMLRTKLKPAIDTTTSSTTSRINAIAVRAD